MKLFTLVSGLLLSVAFTTAHSAPIVSLSAAGTTSTAVAGTTVIDFNSGCGYVTCVGDYQILTGSLSGQYAQPAGTNTPYLSVPNPVANGSATFSLGAISDYFGLYWGSIDSFNSISFILGGEIVANYGGTDLVGQFANGDQVSYNSNRYINFDFVDGGFDSVKLTSTNFAFESDNHAYRLIAAVPEPATGLLVLLGLFGLVGARRRSR